MEGLGKHLLKPREGGLHLRVPGEAKSEEEEFPHLLFANDAIAFIRLVSMKSTICVGFLCGSRIF